MELNEFLRETQASVRSQVQGGDAAQYDELVFADIVMKHMDALGMTSGPSVCYYKGKIDGKALHLCGYAISEDETRLDLFSTIYLGADELVQVPDEDIKKAAVGCRRFLQHCVNGSLAQQLDPSSEVHSLAKKLQSVYTGLDQVQIFVLTDGQADTTEFRKKNIEGKITGIEVMDIGRLHLNVSQGRVRDELQADFKKLAGQPLPCVYIKGENDEYDYALTAIPGHVLQKLYERYGTRLLEANVRSFLGAKGSKSINAGIRDTLLERPERFMAYNNGLVIVADEVRTGRTNDGGPGIAAMKGFQIVNGGQTTASMYFTGRQYPQSRLSDVRVCSKIIVMNQLGEPGAADALIADISHYANSQNKVQLSDLSANHPFHKEVERLARTIYCPDGVGQWFYERVKGSYETLLAREGITPAKRKAIRDSIPRARRLDKEDLARCLLVWDYGWPDEACKGLQSGFSRFMEVEAQRPRDITLSPSDFKVMMAKVIVYRETQQFVQHYFPVSATYISMYTVAVISKRFGARIRLDEIWHKQSVSPEFAKQIVTWAGQVLKALQNSAGEYMLSAWAKREACRRDVLSAYYTPAEPGIPEIVYGERSI